MQKKLAQVGNSLALVIDKPIREALGIGRNTLIDVSFDGKRIVLVPQAPRPPKAVDIVDAQDVIKQLRLMGMEQPEFARLDPAGRNLIRFMIRLGAGDDPVMPTLRRCLEELQNGASWDEAIQRAANQTPSAMIEASMIETQLQIT